MLTGVIVRLVLAPITSWGADTGGFVLGDVQLLYTGSPYGSELFFNPPLAPLVQAPFVLLALFGTAPHALVDFVPSLVPAAEATGIASPLLPSPAALLAIKLPLIFADAVIGLLLYRLVRPTVGLRSAEWIAAGWLLNPLVIWTTAVHGEVDSLAVLFVLLTIWTLVHREFLLAGVCLTLGVFAKAYPLGLIPMALAYAFLLPRASPSDASRTRRVGTVGLGLLLGVIPFLPWVGNFLEIVQSGTGSPSYGGLSIVIIYNAAVPKAWASLSVIQSTQLAGPMLTLLRTLTVIAIAASPAVLLFARRDGNLTGGPEDVPLLGTIAAWCVVGILLASSAPESENMLGAVGLLLLTTKGLRRTAKIALVAISTAGLGLYFALLTPAAFFYPLAAMLGPRSIDWINAVVITYATSPGLISQGTTWLITGLLGGGALLLAWAACFDRLVPWRKWRDQWIPR